MFAQVGGVCRFRGVVSPRFQIETGGKIGPARIYLQLFRGRLESVWRGKPGSITGYSLRSLGDAWWGINWNADSTSARVIATIFLGWREGRERETERKGNRVENIERFSMEMVLILFERTKIDERRSKPSSSRLIIHLSHRLSR